MLDLHRLRVFRSVVATGSVQAAADRLGYTPSAVSQHVSALQRETGLVLVERVGRGIAPTPAGLRIAEEADAVLARLGAAEAVVTTLRSGRRDELSVAAVSSAGVVWLPEVARELATGHPEVDLRIAIVDAPPSHLEEHADLRIVVGQATINPPAGYRSERLLTEPYVAVLPVAHPLAALDEVPLPELAGERWLVDDVAGGWCRTHLLEACAAAGFRPSIEMELVDSRITAAFVEAGLGVAVLPVLATERFPDGAVTRPLAAPAPERSVHVLVRAGVEASPAGATALDVLRRLAAERVARCAPSAAVAR